MSINRVSGESHSFGRDKPWGIAVARLRGVTGPSGNRKSIVDPLAGPEKRLNPVRKMPYPRFAGNFHETGKTKIKALMSRLGEKT